MPCNVASAASTGPPFCPSFVAPFCPDDDDEDEDEDDATSKRWPMLAAVSGGPMPRVEGACFCSAATSRSTAATSIEQVASQSGRGQTGHTNQ